MKRLSYIKKRSLIPGRADRELRVRVSNFGGVCAVPLAFKGTPFPLDHYLSWMSPKLRTCRR